MCRELALAAGLLLGACGSPAASAPAVTFSSDALLKVESESGALEVEVRTSPQPPTRGKNVVQLKVTTAQDGQGVAGLQLDVQPWMPDMGHGSSVTPTVTDEGGGVYLVDDVYLAMPGTWQLRTTLAGTSSDHATPSFQIP